MIGCAVDEDTAIHIIYKIHIIHIIYNLIWRDLAKETLILKTENSG
jgi:hypothetical protein